MALIAVQGTCEEKDNKLPLAYSHQHESVTQS